MPVCRERYASNLPEEFLGSLQKRLVSNPIIFVFGVKHVPQLFKKLQFAASASRVVDARVSRHCALAKRTPIIDRFVQVILDRAFIPFRLQVRKRRFKNSEIVCESHSRVRDVARYLPIISPVLSR
jgi:hypothetical protein